MRAALLREHNGPFDLVDVDIDDPGPGAVRVAVRASGLCHTDQGIWRGEIPMPLPTVLGHEVAGAVEAVGDGVTYVSPGDHVVGCLSAFCGYCVTGHPSRCQNLDAVRRPAGARPRLSVGGSETLQFAELSGFAEQVLVHERALVEIDPSVPFTGGRKYGGGDRLRRGRAERGAGAAGVRCRANRRGRPGRREA